MAYLGNPGREGTGSGGTEPDGRVFVIDPLGFKTYPFEMQPARIQSQHTRGQGGGYLRDDWRWDITKGEWQQPLNQTNLMVTGTLAAPFAAYGAGALAGAGPAAGPTTLAPSAAPAAAPGVVPATTGLTGAEPFLGTSAFNAGWANVPAGLASTPLGPGYAPTPAGSVPSGAIPPGGVSPGSSPSSIPNTVQQAAPGGIGEIIRKIAAAGIPAAALIGNRLNRDNNGGTGNGSGGVPPELSELLAQAMRRMADQEPLFQAVNRQALAGLPDYAKKGGA